MTDAWNELQDLVLRHAPREGLDDRGHAPRPPVLPRVMLWAARAPMGPMPAMFEPMLYFAFQGAKRLSTGDRTVEYGAGSMFLASLDVPVTWTVTGATPAQPYLAAALRLDPAVIAAMLLEAPPPTEAEMTEEVEALALAMATDAMLDPLRRLLRLLDTPPDAPLLAPMFERELLYRVLQSPRGVILRQIARTGSRLSQIQRAVKWIRAHLAEPLPVETLAGVASMSVSSFHRHFKAATGLSPLAFHKQVRLQEARQRLLVSPGAVASVAFDVGYESASQFSREYARQFGVSPARDAARLRGSLRSPSP